MHISPGASKDIPIARYNPCSEVFSSLNILGHFRSRYQGVDLGHTDLGLYSHKQMLSFTTCVNFPAFCLI